MRPEQENFEALRRLLALKRYEQPPPGYFDELHRRIILRIRSRETGDSNFGVANFFWEAPWLQRILAAIERQPVFVRAFGLSACALLVGAVVWSVAPAQPASRNLVLGFDSVPAATATAAGLATGFALGTNGVAAAGQDPIFEQYDNSRNPFQAKVILVGQPGPP